MLRALVATIGAAITAVVATAQATPERQHAAFVRALVRPPFGFESLAEDLAARLPGEAGQQLWAEVALLAAEVLNDPAEREARYRRALQRLDHGREPGLLGDACLAYGRFLCDELERARRNGDRAWATRVAADAQRVLRRGLAACDRSTGDLLAPLRSLLLCQLAELDERAATDIRSQARTVVEEYIFCRCVDPFSRGMLVYAHIGVLLGEDEERMYRDLAASNCEELRQVEPWLDPEWKARWQEVIEGAYHRLARLLLATERDADVIELAAEHRLRVLTLGLRPGTTEGDGVRLCGAVADWRLARRERKDREANLAVAEAQAIVGRHGGIGPLVAEAQELADAMQAGNAPQPRRVHPWPQACWHW